MAVITRAEITLYHNVDIVSVTRYYLLQPSTAAAPAKPTANPPGGSWVTAEPAYTTGSTNSLYTCELTVFSDGKYSYSDVSLSSSYEAAKAAYNRAVLAQETAENIEIGGRNLILNTLYPDASGPKRPRIFGQQVNTSGRNTCTVAEHGIRFTLTSVNWQYIYFGSSANAAAPDMLGLEPGETYTLSADLSWKILSSEAGMADAATCYMGGQLNYSTSESGAWSTAKRDDQLPITQADKGTDMSGRLIFTFTVPADAVRLYLGIRANNSTTSHYAVGDYIEARNLKLEKGNKATDWTPAPEDLQASVDALQPELITGTHGTAATASWTGTSAVLTEITTGTRIQFKLSSAGASNVTLNLTLKDGTTTGAKPVYYSNTTRLGTQYGAGAVVDLIYDGEAWRVLNPYTNSNTVGAYAGAVKAGTNGVKNYSLVMRDTADTWVSLTTSAGTGTSKARYTGGLYPDKVLYMGSNSAYAAGATTGNCYEALGLNLNYSTNSGSTLTAGKAVYLVGELHSDGLFYLDPVWWTQTLPTTENGKTYIYLGLAYSTSNIYLTPENTLYQFYEGKFRKLSEIEEMKAAKTATNYIYDSQALGLIVAREAPASDSDVSTIGWHTRQTADGFDVYYNSTRVAHYGTEVRMGDRANAYYLEQTNSGIKIFRENPDGSNIFKDDEDDGKYFETVMMIGSHNGEHNVIDQLGVIKPGDFSGGKLLCVTDYSNMISGTLQVWLSAQDNSSKQVLTSGTDYTYEDDELTILLSSNVSNYLTSVYNSTGKYPVGIVNYRIRNTTLHYDLGVRDETKAIGLRSFVSGHQNSAQGENSAAFGEGNNSCDDNCAVFGQYNDPSAGSRPLFMVGCGTSDSNRKNAFYVENDGTVVFPGTIEYDALAGDDFRHYYDPESNVSWNTTYVNTSEQLELTIHTWGRIVHVMGTFTAKATIPNAVNIATGLPAPEGRIISLYGVNAANNTPINFSITTGGALQKWYAGSIAAGNICRFGGLYIVK